MNQVHRVVFVGQRWSLNAALAFVTATIGSPALSQLIEDTKTKSYSCQELGIRYAKCALAVAANGKCVPEWDFVQPDRCKDGKDFNSGIAQGTKAFVASSSGQIPKSSVSPSSSSLVTERPIKVEKRRLSAAECRLMEGELPNAARQLSDWSIGSDKVRAGIIERTELPEAAGALVGYLIVYNQESLRAFPYELATEFAKKCEAGTIRAKVNK